MPGQAPGDSRERPGSKKYRFLIKCIKKNIDSWLNAPASQDEDDDDTEFEVILHTVLHF